MQRRILNTQRDYPGRFIVFEGIDGSGKSSQIQLLKPALEKEGYSIVTTSEPTRGGYWGKKIRCHSLGLSEQGETLVDPSDWRTFTQWFINDRKEHLDRLITPALGEGKIVLCDRHRWSTLVYQQAEGGTLEELERMHTENGAFFVPDLTILCDVPVKVALERLSYRKSTDSFEKETTLRKAREHFLELAEHYKETHHAVLVDATATPQEMLDSIYRATLNSIRS